LDQILPTKINFSNFSVCNLHLQRLIRIPAKENILSVAIYEPITPKICHAKKPMVGNIA
jgi:hypothetical protein